MQERLQKILARMGIASRRKAEEMILEGRVRVNGEVAIIGQKADPMVDHIKLDGKLLGKGGEPMAYYALYKPVNVLTTLGDEGDRKCITDFLKGVKARVYPVGRLDFDSEGLLVITNDGELAHALTHPSKKVPKVYRVKVKGIVPEKQLVRLRRGIMLKDGKTSPAEVKKLRIAKQNSWLEVIISQGKKRQIRRMMEAVGHQVLRLIRTRVGPLAIGHMKPGELRRLSMDEVKKLKYSAGITGEGTKK